MFAIDINICYNAVLLQVAGEEWGENEKGWVEKVGEKKMAAFFSHDRARGSRWAFCVFLPRKSNLVDYLG